MRWPLVIAIALAPSVATAGTSAFRVLDVQRQGSGLIANVLFGGSGDDLSVSLYLHTTLPNRNSVSQGIPLGSYLPASGQTIAVPIPRSPSITSGQQYFIAGQWSNSHVWGVGGPRSMEAIQIPQLDPHFRIVGAKASYEGVVVKLTYDGPGPEAMALYLHPRAPQTAAEVTQGRRIASQAVSPGAVIEVKIAYDAHGIVPGTMGHLAAHFGPTVWGTAGHTRCSLKFPDRDIPPSELWRGRVASLRGGSAGAPKASRPKRTATPAPAVAPVKKPANKQLDAWANRSAALKSRLVAPTASRQKSKTVKSRKSGRTL